ncbi:hypothetical protein C8Q70DRAFT_690113 [Cubamyces menziesii]|nr:hypothetical protein C8Q70DRAFT_690113 [Cubamyces menziesii]
MWLNGATPTALREGVRVPSSRQPTWKLRFREAAYQSSQHNLVTLTRLIERCLLSSSTPLPCPRSCPYLTSAHRTIRSAMDPPNTNGIQYDQYALTTMRQFLASAIVSFLIESVLFGAFTVTYTQGTWSLLRIGSRSKPSRREWAVSLASTVMLILALGHLILSLQDLLYGFVTHSGSLDSVYAALDDSFLNPKLGVYITQMLIGDMFMMYRLFIVWNRRKRVIIAPAILTTIGAVTGYWSLIEGSVLEFNGSPIIFCVTSIFTNVLSTVLIMWRILRPSRGATVPPPLFTRRFALARTVAEAIVQSAAIYTVASTSLLVTYFVSPNVGYLSCLNIFPSLIGLVFSFIVLRVAKRRPKQDPDSMPWQTQRNTRLDEGDERIPTVPMTRRSCVLLTPPVQIHLSPLSSSADTLPVARSDFGSVVNIHQKPLVLERL